MRPGALYICYLNVAEPLVRTQVIAYLSALAKGGHRVHLLTFEKEDHESATRGAIGRELEAVGIAWHSLRYHSKPSLPATLYDIAVGSIIAKRLCAQHGIGLLHGRSYVGAAMGLLQRWLERTPLLFDVRGLLPDEYADAGHWRRSGLAYRLTKRMERVLFGRSDAIVFLTDTIRRSLLRTEPSLRGRDSDISTIPCCVDTTAFRPDPERRALERGRRRWDGKLVITYVGKLGTWYLADEMADFFATARTQDDRWFLQVWTQSDGSIIGRRLQALGLPSGAFAIDSAPPGDIPHLLQAADAGLSFIKSSYSKESSSPTKVAEYLAAGLPVVSTRGIGDCDSILANPGLGVMVSEFSTADYLGAARTLVALLADPATRELCRAYASEHLSIDKVAGPRYAAIYDRFLVGSQAAETPDA